ncbi:thiopeptide-type bacteriocin biosynthesis protein [Micromonospora sp. NPDC048170]|uniref:thiopeptide-type bacteriocin biosynthesis protein n=1 Tax=Micromonospora sp. NPDC048170 TaxID=3154819 RepID=UPI003401DCD8
MTGRPGSGLSPVDWCLVRVPMLPATPRPDPADTGADGLSDRLLDLAVAYATTYGRTPEPDQDGRDDPTLRAMYASRARHRPTPFGLFAFSARADLVDQPSPTTVDLETEVMVHPVDVPRPDGGWLVNPTLAADAGRWMYVRPDRGGASSAPDTPVLRQIAHHRESGPRPAADWIADLGQDRFDQYVERRVLLPAHTPGPFVDPGASSPVATVGAVTGRPFDRDRFVDAFSKVRPALDRGAARTLVAGAAQVLGMTWTSNRLSSLRGHLESAVTGGAVPLSWLLSAPVDHPLGSWRRDPAPTTGTAPPPGPVRRLFVPARDRDTTLVDWWNTSQDVDAWRPRRPADGDGPTGPVAVAEPPTGMVCGVLLAAPVSDTDVWLKVVMPGLWAGPGARLADLVTLPPPPENADLGRLTVELGWTPTDARAPLTRRPAGSLPRLNLNLPRRPGDIGLDDLAVTVFDGRLHLVYRRDGRPVELRFDSPLNLDQPLNPWVVRLLGMIAAEGNATGRMVDPSYRLPPGSPIPRITGGRCLFARRGVVLDDRHRADLLALAGDPAALAGVLTEVGLGPVIEVTERSADLTMRVDVTDADHRRWLVRRLRRPGLLVLHEALPVATPVTSRLGEHAHDVWVPWVRVDARPTPRLSPTRIVDRPPAADPEWTSWYVYAPDRMVETWLARPDVLALMDRAELFYIRYRDDRPHLRLRLRATAASPELLADLRTHLAAWSPHHPCPVETYPWVPEDHRYGGPVARAATVRHFCADSAWWTRRVARAPEPAGRYALAVTRIATWCHQLAADDAVAFLANLRGLDPRLPSNQAQREWMATYRAARTDLDRRFAQESGTPDPTLAHLAGLDPDARVLTFNSMIHMTVNRGMPVSQAVSREPEIVLAAARVLRARAARAATPGGGRASRAAHPGGPDA